MEIPNDQAKAATEQPVTTTVHNAAVDNLTTAIITGASPAEIERLEASAAASQPEDGPHGDARPASEQLDNQAGASQPSGADTPAQSASAAQPPGVARQAADDHEAQRQQSAQSALELYHDLEDKDSPLCREANRIATDPSHPDYDADLLAKASGPLKIAKLAAANLGIPPSGVGASATRSDADSFLQPRSVVRPAAATKQSAPPPPAKSVQDIVRASEAAALDAIEGRTARNVNQPERAYLRL